MMIYKNILGLIHNTPIVQLKELESSYLKLEFFNPMNSVKDRTAFALIQDAIKKGQIKKDTVLVEATSGNTGIALAYISRVLNIELILVMPEGLSTEREIILKSFAVKVIFTPKNLGMDGSLTILDKLLKENPKYLTLKQFENSANPRVHMEYTAKEIIRDFDQGLDVFVSSVGTGGTITGTAKELKKHYPNIEIIAVEPKAKTVIAEKKQVIYDIGQEEDESNNIQGIGAGFIPKILDLELIDIVCRLSNQKAIDGVLELAQSDGMLVGLSSGAVFSAIKYLKQMDKYKNKKILGIAPDAGERYLSVLTNI